jgi:hypothetical protein
MYDKRFILWFISRLRQLRLSSQSAFPTKRIICSREAKNGGGGFWLHECFSRLSACANNPSLLYHSLRPFSNFCQNHYLRSTSAVFSLFRINISDKSSIFRYCPPPPPPRHHTKISTTVTKVQKMTLIQ